MDIGLELTPERLARLEWAAPFVTASVAAIAEAEGIDDVPDSPRTTIPVRDEPCSVVPEVTEPYELGVVEAAVAIRRGQLLPAELLASCLTRIERTQPALGAFVRLTDDAARTQADLAGQQPPTGVLHGIPFAAKDLIDTSNVATEYGSAAFVGRVPPWDATVVSRIRSAGGILVGKTATHEIAYGVSTPAVHNPWHPDRMASGSSGGSAAALAARQVPMALGTDTGGSLRLPSAFCGTSAIRPTFGLIPRSGVMTLSASFDVVGPMARSARDCLMLLRVLAGDPPAELVSPVVDLRQVRVGLADVATQHEVAVAETLRSLGAQIIEVTLPSLPITQAAASVLVFAEAAAEFRQHLKRGAEFTEDIQAFLEAGLGVPVADFLHAQRVRNAIKRDYANLLGEVDVLLLPTSPVTELPHGVSSHDGVPLIPVLTPYTFPASLTGLPAIAFPCGFSRSGMPVGAQLMGPAHSETLLAAVVDAYQQETDWHTRIPPV
ncbi:amidase [Kibdelosporangium aridum]|uniref:Aspartyl-tRNA(Asn)/glutamyl-tRNA(Gln) amidotransferase subunit A n=1 Tax=Kibdelosporangium aridum TaxID=2030 RepID=A0A1Y5XQ93_KIBAR|nr:amidase [Kibdelosporangium aridum]SMD11136.1 aspartyl-tRNA(Asn)/glutamyl-tRNA(Gln) amidotransferase subunit A [Kibdelosporangium aridum]